MWEQRYQAVAPKRTPANHRLYSQQDLERLSLLREVTLAGHNIGHVVRLTNDRLRALAAAATKAQTRREAPPTPAPESCLEECLTAIQAFDSVALDDTLHRAHKTLGAQGVLHRVVAPLAQTLGDLWRAGNITAAHEHFATVRIRAFTTNLAQPFGSTATAPGLIVATPLGQLHDLGALLAGATAANLGWSATCLGASLPAPEIAGAAQQKRARAVALSLVYPEDDPDLPGELTRLRDLLPPETTLLAGGRATPAYRDVLERIGAVLTEDLTQFGVALDRLRQFARKAQR